MGNEDWKNALRGYFDSLRVIERCKFEAVENFNQFCEFIAEPAFENLAEELKSYGIKSKFQKSKGSFIGFEIYFHKSKVDNFHYIISLPKNSVDLRLKLSIKGRRKKNSVLEEREEPFMKDIPPSNIMKLDKEDLIQDIIEHYKNFIYRAITSPE